MTGSGLAPDYWQGTGLLVGYIDPLQDSRLGTGLPVYPHLRHKESGRNRVQLVSS